MLGLMDMDWDGLLSDGDELAFYAVESTYPYIDYDVSLVYEPTGTGIASETVAYSDVTTPTALFVRTTVTNGVKVTIASVSEEVTWDDFSITLSDQIDNATWTLSSDYLDDGYPSVHSFGAIALGTLTVYLNATDVLGDGLVGEWDYFILVAVPYGFNIALAYTVEMVYEPTGDAMGSTIFAGSAVRAPIVITSDLEFTEENGVISGSGTYYDPYVIEGWEIYSTTTDCISISGTSAYFVIRDCFLHGDLEGYDGYYTGVANIELVSCSNGAIENVAAVKNDLGINIEYGSNIAISGSDFSGNWYGIHAYPATGLTVTNCTSDDNNEVGMFLGTSSDFVIESSRFDSNWQSGIVIYSSQDGAISGNIISGNGEYGVLLTGGCTFLDVTGNEMTSDSIGILDFAADDFTTITVDATNTVNGKPVMFVEGESGADFDDTDDMGELILANCQSVSVSDLSFTDADIGILMAYVSDSSVHRCSFTDMSMYGVSFEGCSAVTVGNCTASNNTRAVDAYASTDIYVFGNVFSGSEYDAVGFHTCTGGEVADNVLEGSGTGLYMYASSGFTVQRNQMSYNTGIGINLDSTTGCYVYHNDLVGLATLAQDNGDLNSWDDGYPSGGNYWSDYTGEDGDSDGIGDEARVIPPNGVDLYPLMVPYSGTTPSPGYVARAPIHIESDLDCTSENGVVSGDGSSVSPYVIEGWEIDVSHYVDPDLPGGIVVRNVSAQFIIRDCYVHDSDNVSALCPGIMVENATYARLEYLEVDRCAPGICARGCAMLSVSYCVLEDCIGGVELHEVTGGSSVYSCHVIGSRADAGSAAGGIGVAAYRSVNLSILCNTIDETDYTGVLVSSSDEVRVYSNAVSACGRDGIRLQGNITMCEVLGNDVSGCVGGMTLWLGEPGYIPDEELSDYTGGYQMADLDILWNTVYLCQGDAIGCDATTGHLTTVADLTLVGNTVTNNTGTGIDLEDVALAIVYENDIGGNAVGVNLTECSDVLVYHNNIVDNVQQALDDGGNAWDDGYGGNYWSDYAGTDGDADGIGDTAYVVPSGSQDRYPLMMPYPT
jgi:parallel beta-helix repeat protein